MKNSQGLLPINPKIHWSSSRFIKNTPELPKIYQIFTEAPGDSQKIHWTSSKFTGNLQELSKIHGKFTGDPDDSPKIHWSSSRLTATSQVHRSYSKFTRTPIHTHITR